ncbi:hypothetical protein L4D13_16355 [Photobacterium profundum]|uniref:hypothetical protein n=1 Tax=Photobacterium profundum TaxID=74109 RepID=UPI003D106BDD
MNKLASLIFILSFSLSGCDGSETDYLEPDIINTSVIDFPENTSCQTIENQTSCSAPNNKNFVLLDSMKGISVLSANSEKGIIFEVNVFDEYTEFKSKYIDANTAIEINKSSRLTLAPNGFFYTSERSIENLDLLFNGNLAPFIMNKCGLSESFKSVAIDKNTTLSGDYEVTLTSNLLEGNICHIQRIETFNDNGVVTTSNEQYFISQNHGFIKYINSNGEILDN